VEIKVSLEQVPHGCGDFLVLVHKTLKYAFHQNSLTTSAMGRHMSKAPSPGPVIEVVEVSTKDSS
jgi:hypothetical protein